MNDHDNPQPPLSPPSPQISGDGPPPNAYRDERDALRSKVDTLEEELERAAEETLADEERRETLRQIEVELAAAKAQLDRLGGALSPASPRPWYRRWRPSKRGVIAGLGGGAILLGAVAGVAWATGALNVAPASPQAAEQRPWGAHHAARHGQPGPGMCGQRCGRCSPVTDDPAE